MNNNIFIPWHSLPFNVRVFGFQAEAAIKENNNKEEKVIAFEPIVPYKKLSVAEILIGILFFIPLIVISLVKIVLPLSAPGLAAAAVITFMISWHELVIPLIIAPKQEAMTIPVLLANLVTDYRILYTLMNAISLIGLIPTALLAILLRRYVVRGLIAGAIKG